MPSKKALSADNQQERLKIESWILGFTDGEGCFSISFLKNSTTKNGYQLFPEFVITQGAKSVQALKIFEKYFKCGKIFINHRHDNHKEPLYRYCVRSISDLKTNIIPFFQKHKLKTAKSDDFKIFCRVVELMSKGKHKTEKGFQKIANLVKTMNRKKSRLLESPETKR